MGVNRAEQGLDNKLVNDVRGLKRDMRELKTKQPIGADSITVIGVPEVGALLAGPITIIAGSSLTLAVTTIPAGNTLTLWNFAFTIYVDGTSNDDQWPNGANMTLAKRELFVFDWFDWADSSDVTNIRVYKIRLRNSDPGGITHDYYVRFKAYAPLVATS